jgi:dUTPase
MFKKVKEDAILPTRGSKYAACVDVYANEDVVIEAGETQVVGLGIAIDYTAIKMNYLVNHYNSKFYADALYNEFKEDFNKWVESDFYGDFELEMPYSEIDKKYINWREYEEKYGKEYTEDIVYEFAKLDIGKYENFRKSHYLQLSLRSSLGKKGLIMPHGVGVVDLDYRDEIKMVIHNPVDIVTVYSLQENSNPSFIEIKKGDKIGQITLLEHKSYLFGIDSEDERIGGFGSTGA